MAYSSAITTLISSSHLSILALAWLILYYDLSLFYFIFYEYSIALIHNSFRHDCQLLLLIMQLVIEEPSNATRNRPYSTHNYELRIVFSVVVVEYICQIGRMRVTMLEEILQCVIYTPIRFVRLLSLSLSSVCVSFVTLCLLHFRLLSPLFPHGTELSTDSERVKFCIVNNVLSHIPCNYFRIDKQQFQYCEATHTHTRYRSHTFTGNYDSYYCEKFMTDNLRLYASPPFSHGVGMLNTANNDSRRTIILLAECNSRK